MNQKKIYLDHAATTPIHPEVFRTFKEELLGDFGNPSSVHQFGRKARSKIERARSTIAKSIGAKDDEIIFTSGGTEGDNFAILQAVAAQANKGNHIITTKIEHSAVLNTVKFLEKKGIEVTYLEVNQHGQLSLESFDNALREDTILVTIMSGNNEVGTLLPIQEIGERLENHHAYFHTDAVQSFGTETLDVQKLKVDLLSISGHKINVPKGIGFLYVKSGLILPPLFHGGEQELKKRPGTENTPSIVALAKGIVILDAAEKERRKKLYHQFSEIILTTLTSHRIEWQINGDEENKLSHIVNLWIKEVPNDLLLLNLDLAGCAISTGSACTAGNVEDSYVLKSMYGEHHPAVTQSIRISFGIENTVEEIKEFSERLVSTITRLKNINS